MGDHKPNSPESLGLTLRVDAPDLAATVTDRSDPAKTELLAATSPGPADQTGIGDRSTVAGAAETGEHGLTAPTRDGDDAAGGARAGFPTIPGYEIHGELGRGGMGVVYQARQVRLNRTVALKMVLAGAHASPEAATRFLAEAAAVAQLQHPNIVQIFHIDEHAGFPYFEMEFVAGGSLAAQLDGAPRPAREATQLVETLARAMAEAHRQGVVHRDLKPSNILLTPECVPKVADFGLAKLLNVESGLTRTESVLGSPSYMAPEQAGGKTKDVGPAGDVYALGAILYELLTGRPPFRGATVIDTLEQVKAAEPVPPSRLVPGLPRDAETIALKCLQKEPGKRYESAAGLAEDLRRYQSGEPIMARPVGAAERAWRRCKRNPVTAGLLAAIALLLTAVAVGSSTAYVRESRLRAQAVAAGAQARAEAESNRRFRYASDVQLAAQLWESDEGTADQVAALLAAQEPAPGQVDLREFAWRHQWTLLNRSAIALAGHDGAVQALSITPEGRLTTIDSAGTLRIWDPARRVVQHSRGPSPPLQGVPATELSPDVYGAPEFPRRLRGRDVTAVELSHDGRKVAVATGDSVRLIDAVTGGELWAWPRLGLTRLLALSPDGRWLAALGHDRTMTVADTVSGRETVIGSTTLGNVNLGNETALVVSADGRTVWVANAPQIGEVMALGGPTPRIWHAHAFTVWSIAVSPDGRRLASSDFEGRVRLWDAHAPATSEADRAAAIDPLSRGFVDPKVPGTSQADWLAHASRVAALAFSPDGQTLATGGSDAAIAVWDVATARQKRLFKGHFGAIQGLKFSDDGTTLASSDARGVARLWDLSGPEPTRRFTSKLLPVPAFHLAYSRDGRWLATAWSQVVSLWDTRTWKLVHRLPADSDAVYRLAFAPDNQTLATGGRDSVVKLWDVATGQLVRTLRGRHSDPLNYHRDAVGALAFSHDGTRLAAGYGRPGLLDPDYDQIVKVWEVASGRELRTLTGLKNTVSMLAFAPDDRTLATACHDRTVRLWSTATWHELSTLRGPDPWQSVAFAPDGRTLAAGVETSGLIRLWDTADDRAIRDIRGHASGVADLSFAPDGRTLASASWDRTVKLWDLATGRELRTLRGHDGWVMGVAFAPDGLTLATGGYSDRVRLWEAASFDEVAAERVEEQQPEADRRGAGAYPPP